MKRILLTLTALARLTMAHAQNAIDDKTFFSGANLGMTLDEAYAYYTPEIAGGGIAEHSGALAGKDRSTSGPIPIQCGASTSTSERRTAKSFP
jgi:hypothetical protein